MTLDLRYRRTIVSHSRAAWILALLLGVCFLAIPSCKQKDAHGEGDDHDHDKPAAASGVGHSEDDGHDHGHAHAEGEHADEVMLAPEAIERNGVKIGEAQRWVLKPTFVAPARIGFNTEAMAHVGSPLRGRAIEIKVRLGDHVKQNDPLAVIESPELGQAQADFLQKRTAAQAAGPQVDLAKAAWDRAKWLLEKSEGISLTDVQKREAEYKAAVAGQKSAEAAATAAENSLHLLGMDQNAVESLASSGEIAPRYVIRAPIEGQVVQREVTLGELVSPDREAIMVLADIRTFWVLADAPEARLPTIAVGTKAWVTVGSLSGHRYEGQVSFISPLVDPTTRSAQVRVELPASTIAGGAVRPGMFAQVEIVSSTPDRAEPAPQVAVPQEAVQAVEGGPAVFVPVSGEPNTFRKRAITIGPAVGGLVPVFAGLVEGEQYVEEGSFILKAELGKGSAAHEH